MTASGGLLCYCRAGFEPELAAELTERAAYAGQSGHARADRGTGYVVFSASDSGAISRSLPWRELIFARQKLELVAELRALDPRDRVTPILDALRGQGGFGTLLVEHPDSDAGKPLAGLARSFGNALRPALRKAGILSPRDDESAPRLHVCFIDGDHAFVGVSRPRDSSPWPLGIPRLRMHADAPSRSALKLDEALLVLLDADERSRLLQADMRAADLGAAPGGWTWVLTRHGLRVTAIDNGPLRPQLLESGRVEHLRADGFAWRPPQPLDWMVCDMVEQPSRVAERMATWMREGWCRRTIFNLKLPMKKRWQETRTCLDLFAEQSQRPMTIRARQLFHDREEITVYASA
ncbi:23S rRNA (cytidine(2498)-2'-O)-methyltransferase RlmM [Cognatiluteimonas profundi]|uniref:23S rRNA (cytidine(2498)-2'-O)-methyltransferase RlmM n=1 Tax=Cognatiluteimonas profundi TaxID=2594501 RepID=UPI00131AEDDF|nr:23S rRNA (cytidine(2498)-2'-O)-methyltransferase RlmM [Lysobacter profundi]